MTINRTNRTNAVTMQLDFDEICPSDLDRLTALGAVLDVENLPGGGRRLIAELPDVDTINPVDAIWLQELADAHELHPKAPVELAEADAA